MHAPIITHVIYVTVDNNAMYRQYASTVPVNEVRSSFRLYPKSLFTEDHHARDNEGMFCLYS